MTARRRFGRGDMSPESGKSACYFHEQELPDSPVDELRIVTLPLLVFDYGIDP